MYRNRYSKAIKTNYILNVLKLQKYNFDYEHIFIYYNIVLDYIFSVQVFLLIFLSILK